MNLLERKYCKFAFHSLPFVFIAFLLSMYSANADVLQNAAESEPEVIPATSTASHSIDRLDFNSDSVRERDSEQPAVSSKHVISSPLRNSAFYERFGSDTSVFDDSQPIVELAPLVVSPLKTSTDRLIQDMRKEYDQFLTAKGWSENFGYRSMIDDVLNSITLPFFGIDPEFIAAMYAYDAKLEHHLDVMDRIIDTQSLREINAAKKYEGDRYDLMRMKRHALFGNSWAVPEIGK